MKRILSVIALIALSACSGQPALQAHAQQQVAQPQQPVQGEKPAEAPKKVCNSPDNRTDVMVCDFGAVITIFGNGWGNSFRKADILPPAPPEKASKK